MRTFLAKLNAGLLDYFNTENQKDDLSHHNCEDPILHDKQMRSNAYKLSAPPLSPDDERITDVPGEENGTFNDETTVQEDLPNTSTRNKDMRQMMKEIYQEMRKNSSYPEQASEYLTTFHAYPCKISQQMVTHAQLNHG